MADHLAKGEELEKKADKKINGWGLFGSKYDDAAELYAKSVNYFKLAKSCTCHNSCLFLVLAYIDAANCYKKTSNKGAMSCLERAVNMFLNIGRYRIWHCKEIGELYELEKNTENATSYFEQAAEYFENGESTTSANQCKLKVAQFSAEHEQ